jgi:hypothetical protein
MVYALLEEESDFATEGRIREFYHVDGPIGESKTEQKRKWLDLDLFNPCFGQFDWACARRQERCRLAKPE